MKDAYYFTHDCNARNDVKVLKLRRILGSSGYGIFWMIIEVLRETKDYKLPLSAVKDLSFDFREPEEVILSIINDFDLFKIDGNHFFFSESLSKRMLALDVKRKKLSEAGKRGRAKQLSLGIGEDSTATPKQKEGPPPGSKEDLLNKINKSGLSHIYNSFSFFNDEFGIIWFDEYLPVKVKKKAAITERAIKSQLNKINELSGGNYTLAKKILEKTVNSGWTDFYPLKEDSNNQKQTQPNPPKYRDLENYKRTDR